MPLKLQRKATINLMVYVLDFVDGSKQKNKKKWAISSLMLWSKREQSYFISVLKNEKPDVN